MHASWVGQAKLGQSASRHALRDGEKPAVHAGISYSQTWSSLKFDKPKHKARYELTMAQINKYWKPDSAFRLLHTGSESYLGSNENAIPATVCPSCDKKKLTEVVSSDTTHKLDPMNRWYVKHRDHAPFDCDSDYANAVTKYPAHLSMYKTWPKYRRKVRPGDFVAWRDQSESRHACENNGKIHVGFVRQVQTVTGSLTIDPWLPLSADHAWKQVYVSKINSEYPRDAQDKPIYTHGLVTLPIANVYGPLQHSWFKKAEAANASPMERLDQGVRGKEFKDIRDAVKVYVRHIGDAFGNV